MNKLHLSRPLRLSPIAQALAIGFALGSSASALATPARAQPATPVWLLAQADADIPIYGSQLMTDAERADYRSRWRAARSDDERERLRSEHHDRMQERARDRGVTLPHEPPPRGAGPGPGGGAGPGPGPGPR
jgi:hypothetical protein